MCDENDSDFLESELSDDDLELFMDIPRRKNENYLEVIVPQYDDEAFFMNFRIKREHTNKLAEGYQNSELYKPDNGQYGKLSPLDQILIFLWFTGHQTARFRDVSERFNISISSVHRIIRRVTVFVSNLSVNCIRWPTDNEKELIEQHFQSNGFPNVIGAIDGCHIKIDKPQRDPESYMNQKGFYSIQMQVVCDHNRKITDIFVGYPGAVHDATVYRNSTLSANLQQMCGQYVLLGDSAYPLTANLLVTFKDRGQLTEGQVNYNVQLSKNRYVIEHTFEILKHKFRQLHHVKLKNVTYIVHFIRAACVLHNICLHDDFFVDGIMQNKDVLMELNNDVDDEEEPDMDARRIRDNFVNIVGNNHD